MTDLLLRPRTEPDEIAKRWTLQVEKNADPGLCVHLLVPKDWQKFEPYSAPPNQSGLDLILYGRYGDRDGKGLIDLHSQKIMRELSSSDWFEWFAKEGGFRVEKRHLQETPAGYSIDALATKRGKDGRPFLYRMSTFKDGDRVYLISGYAHPQDFAELEDAFVVAINTFKLTNGTTSWSAEPIRNATMSRVVPVQLEISRLWQRILDAGVQQPDVERLHFESSGGNKTMGRLTIEVARGSVYADAGAMANAMVSKIDGAPRTGGFDPFPVSGPLGEVQHGVAPFAASDDDEKKTLRFAIGRLGDAWVGVALVLHHWPTGPYPVDAINHRAFEIVLRTLRPASAAGAPS